jgi:hypothetical protein
VGSRPIDKQLLAALVFLAQHHVLFAAPAVKQLTETGVAIPPGLACRHSFQKQLLGQVLMYLPLMVKLGKIRHRQRAGAANLSSILTALQKTEGVQFELWRAGKIDPPFARASEK